ncbi:MAG: energy-coupling factor ABC transporter substrate-binding protein [Candidatus Accumulibacter sp.]|jgi:cobalt/nickel transport protein|nr:energy-coupling factor ABC transporter substrate-binding protein [Accumulibacter sp.]
MNARSNLWLLSGVVALVLIPFWVAPPPKTEEEAARMFLGADGKAMDLVAEISPDYRPWFKPLIEPSSSEIASLLFSFQAALGAGVIGYYIGSAKTREKMRREFEAAGRKAETGSKAALIDPCEAERVDSGRAD